MNMNRDDVEPPAACRERSRRLRIKTRTKATDGLPNDKRVRFRVRSSGGWHFGGAGGLTDFDLSRLGSLGHSLSASRIHHR
jgi:hypothetical protein